MRLTMWFLDRPAVVSAARRKLARVATLFGAGAIALAVVLTFAGCAAAGTSAGGSTPPTAAAVSIVTIPDAAWNGMVTTSFSGGALPASSSTYAAYTIMLFGYLDAILAQSFIEATLSGWTTSQPPTYTTTEGGTTYTISWSQSGSIWTWTVSTITASGSETLVVTVTSTSTGWDVRVTENGGQLLTGSVASDGKSGQATLTDPTGAESGSVTTAWATDSAPYDYKFTITATGSSFVSEAVSGDTATTAQVILRTNTAGTIWEWTYSDNATPPGSASGSSVS